MSSQTIVPMSPVPGMESPHVAAFSSGVFPAMPDPSLGEPIMVQQPPPRSVQLQWQQQQQQAEQQQQLQLQHALFQQQQQQRLELQQLRYQQQQQQQQQQQAEPVKEKRRRWSLSGRLFDRRKSATEPFHVPNSHPQAFAQAYNSSNSNIVGSHPAAVPSIVGHNIPCLARLPPSPQSNAPVYDNTGRMISPSVASSTNGNGSGRRTSLADIPKAIISSLRRGSTSSSGHSGNMVAPTSRAIVVDGGNAVDEEDDDEEGEEDSDEGEAHGPSATIWTTSGFRDATLALPKGPPRDPKSLTPSPIPRGILKKRPQRTLETPSAVGSPSQGSGLPGSGGHHGRMLSPEFVHPMSMDGTDINMDITLLTPTDHRARLETRSPVPGQPHSHPQQQPHSRQPDYLSPSWAPNGAPFPGQTSPALSPVTPQLQMQHTSALMPPKDMLGYASQGAAMPPEFTPGIQANFGMSGRGGERAEGMVAVPDQGGYVDHINVTRFSQLHQAAAAAAAASSTTPSSSGSFISPRAQELSNQYYGLSPAASPASSAMAKMTVNMDPFQESISQQQNSSDDPYMQSSRTTMGMMMRDQEANSGGGGGTLSRLGDNSVGSGFNGTYNYGNLGHAGYGSPMMGGDFNRAEGEMESGTGGSDGGGGGGGGGWARRRSIGFADSLEIIPVYRKSEYNRRSDKHSTFKNLTPELKSEIRDELNTFKMREMAVHVESMGNTAFH